MDPRVREHAKILVDDCMGVEKGEEVIVSTEPAAEDLAVAVFELLGDRGANGTYMANSARVHRAYMNHADPDDFTESAVTLAAIEAADVYIRIRAPTNTHERGDVDPESTAAYQKTNQAISEAVSERRWVLTQYPSSGSAQAAEMSTDAYEDFVWNAVNKDWQAQYEHQEQLVELLTPADEVHIRSGDTTDITMSVAGMNACNDHGTANMPAGEVFIGPIPESVEGEVLFDMPLMTLGREVENVRLVFEGGEVVEHSADKNEDVLTALLNTDDGARRLGELGIGMNRDIDQFTYNMLFDEKMGDTVHMALGRSVDENVPEEMESARNESAIHVDMIVDMSEDSVMEFDGEVVQRNGTFVFEDGFE